jgi:hypothetical protein
MMVNPFAWLACIVATPSLFILAGGVIVIFCISIPGMIQMKMQKLKRLVFAR